MGGSKQKETSATTYQGTNTYGWETPPETADITAMRDFKFEKDPRLPYVFGKARQRNEDSFNNPMGAATSPALRDAILRAGNEEIGQAESQAYREENYGLQGLEYAKKADLAAMTQGRMVQSGQAGSQSGNSTIQQSQSPMNLLGSAISGGSGIASALIM